MKRILFTLLITFLIQNLEAQVKVYKYWVEFTDKKDNGFSIDHPEAFLSNRAIERRKKQGIQITEQDLPVTAAYRDGISALGAQVLYTSKWFNAASIRTTDSSLIDRIDKLPYVKSSRLLYMKIEFDAPEKGPSAMMEYMMTRGEVDERDGAEGGEFGSGAAQISQINGIPLHKAGMQGQGMIIAVLDAGFYKVDDIKTFDKMRDDGRLIGTKDFVEFDSTVFDDDMHGMNVLSCMASYTPNKMIGTAPMASYWLIRTEDANTENPIEEANWVAGAEFADSAGADLINSSLGYTTYDIASMSYTYKNLDGTSLISRAATVCASKGLIVCNAAGNEGDGKWKYVGVPADAENIISVGGVTYSGAHAGFSSYGPTADGRIKPTVSARAAGTVVVSSKGKFYNSNGTSFASPVMCGMVACLWQANPTATNLEVIEAIKKSASQANNPDNVLGYGIPDFELANRILGGDKSFDYTTDQWLKAIPETYYNEVIIDFYSSKDQKIEIVVRDRKGRKVRSFEKDLKKGEFLKEVLDNLPTSKKGITIDIKIGDESKSYSLKRLKP